MLSDLECQVMLPSEYDLVDLTSRAWCTTLYPHYFERALSAWKTLCRSFRFSVSVCCSYYIRSFRYLSH